MSVLYANIEGKGLLMAILNSKFGDKVN